MSDLVKVDILVAGGGSAGFGAAYAACVQGGGRLRIAVVDSNSLLGGSSTEGGVNAWEMGIGGPGVHREVADILLRSKQAAILKGHWEPLVRNRPYALHSPDDRYVYEDTLRAAGIHDRVSNHNSFIFEPGAMASIMLGLLKEKGGDGFSFHKNETVTGVETDGKRISSVITDRRIFKPEIVIDCTGDIAVSRMAGCRSEMTPRGLNGVTQVYRVTPKGYESIDALEADFLPPYEDPGFEERLDAVRVISSINMYPGGDLNINQLPTMDGDEFFSMDTEKARMICTGRVHLHWRRLQQDSPFMRRYRIKDIFPMIGIREGYRLRGRYVLTADDVLSGFRKQNHKDRIIAFSDHPIDIHGGKGSGLRILDEPYGIPYECIVPEITENLLTACRGSSFDSTAAASCRLSRSMISLGEAAGTAAVVSINSGSMPAGADVDLIRRKLGIVEFTGKLLEEFSG